MAKTQTYVIDTVRSKGAWLITCKALPGWSASVSTASMITRAAQSGIATRVGKPESQISVVRGKTSAN